MSIVHGTYKSGHIELDSPVDWPEGAKVEILPFQVDERHEDYGMNERNWPTTKEGIEALIAHMDACEPVQYSPEDLARIEAAQKWIDDFTRAAVARDMGLQT